MSLLRNNIQNNIIKTFGVKNLWLYLIFISSFMPNMMSKYSDCVYWFKVCYNENIKIIFKVIFKVKQHQHYYNVIGTLQQFAD